MNDALRRQLLQAGATVVGFASVEEGLTEEFRHLGRAVSIGVNGNLRENNLDRLRGLEKVAARFFRSRGYRFFCIPPDSDRITDTFASRLYPLFTHKMAATSAGMGWVGRNGLLISRRYGPKLSFGTVLTDAPLQVDQPIETSGCGRCELCAKHCPSGAITGRTWSRAEPFPQLVDITRCTAYKKTTKEVNGKPNCGLCITICPFGRQQRKERASDRTWRTNDEQYP